MANNSKNDIDELTKISKMTISNRTSMKTDGTLKKGTGKREDYLAWDEFFMGIAFLSAQRSKDPVTQVGACIVNEDKHIVGIGYNGFPINCDDDEFPWTKESDDPLKNKYMFVVHAEVNAILNKNCFDLKGCVLYVALFPCNECAKVIIQSRIREVVYVSDKHAYQPNTIASKRLLDAAKIPYRQFVPKNTIIVDFSKINEN